MTMMECVVCGALVLSSYDRGGVCVVFCALTVSSYDRGGVCGALTLSSFDHADRRGEAAGSAGGHARI